MRTAGRGDDVESSGGGSLERGSESEHDGREPTSPQTRSRRSSTSLVITLGGNEISPRMRRSIGEKVVPALDERSSLLM